MYHARQTMLNVEESDRLSFLPDLFGNDFLAGEMQVYALAEKHITDYCGGFWHFIRIPEGGGYMMPDGDRFHLTNPDNWFDRSVSADAAGVIITALAINRRIRMRILHHFFLSRCSRHYGSYSWMGNFYCHPEGGYLY